jgi:hypothetical protein
MAQLKACNGCSRHVWSYEDTCPFCGCKVTSVAESVRFVPRNGLSRGQRLVLAAAFAGQALGACAETTTNGPDLLPDGGPIAGRAGSAGLASVAAAGQGASGVSGANGFGNIAPPYGAAPPPPPPPPDAGKNSNPPDDDAGDEDAGTQ